MTAGCMSTCAAPTPGRAHCPTCHGTFGSVTAFDAHRQKIAARIRPAGPLKRCVDPRTVGLIRSGGIWVRPMPDDARARVRAAGRR